MLGINPSSDPLAYSKVRLEWPTGGQPAFAITDDVAFLRTTEEDDQYNRIRDRQVTPHDSASLTTTDTYTRVWRVDWTCYGPTSFDNARLLKSGMLLDFSHGALAASNLYLVTDIPATTRAPELFQGQWWDRSDVHLRLNELVTETTTVASIATAEVRLYTVSGLVADLN